LPPGKTEAYAPRMDAVPGLGENTNAILEGLGWSSEDIASMRSAGAI
jgi:itaconate CoA-transferase